MKINSSLYWGGGKNPIKGLINNLTATEEGYALDASQGKILHDKCDFIIEESIGTDGKSRYIKWNSGILEQFYKNKNASASINSPYGNTIMKTGDFVWYYPIVFTKTPDYCICIKAKYDTGASWGQAYSYSNAYCNIRLIDLVSRPLDNKLDIDIYVRGRWK